MDKPLLDIVTDRFDEDKARREADLPTPAPEVSPDQLSLFDVSDSGELVSFEGETL